jgi:hypothetical protein
MVQFADLLRILEEMVQKSSQSGGSFSISILTPRTVRLCHRTQTRRKHERMKECKEQAKEPSTSVRATARLVWTSDSESFGRLVLCHLPAMQMPFSAGCFIGSPELVPRKSKGPKPHGPSRRQIDRLPPVRLRYVTDSKLPS